VEPVDQDDVGKPVEVGQARRELLEHLHHGLDV